MLAAVNESVSFHVDCSPIGPIGELEFEWTCNGEYGVSANDPRFMTSMPPSPGLVTISVKLRRKGEWVAFGTCSFFLLSQEELERAELLIGVRELVYPEDPNNALAGPLHDPLDLEPMLYSNRIPWIKERAQRIARGAERLTPLSRDEKT
jgi:hypothetical protein